MPTLQYFSHSEADNPSIAEKILHACKSAKIFAFYGNLGAGKTTLIKSFCQTLGVKESITSPTFNLVNEYQGTEDTIYHFDFYRIRKEEEAYDIGSDEYFDSESYCFIEWPERVPTLLPEEAVRITLRVVDAHSREIAVTF